ncbi:MAG: hypothetical protein WCA27_01590 [Candidatus Sulfotelmatobacter sp.]
MANWFGRVETIVVGILSCVFGAILFSRLDRGLPIWASFFVGPGLWIVGGSIAMSWLFNRMFQRAQRSPRLETPAGANQTHKAEMPDSSRAALQTSATEAEQVRIEPAGSTSANPVLLSTPVDAEPTPDYFWVVTCKNDRFHQKENIFYHHRILLGETDSYSSLPMLPVEFKVRCDSCREECSYSRKEVLRAEVQVRETFTPHPLFSP